jgi:glucose-1-phosphate thymidylyltransferase
MLAVVLAAGRGTRLRPLTNERAKAMMPIVGKPMVERVLDMLANGGATHFILVAHPAMLDLFKHLSRSPWADGIHLVYQEQRLGMAHAVGCAARCVRERGEGEFLLASCDSLYREGHVARLIARHRRDGLDATLTLMWVPPEKATVSAVVILKDGMVADIVEKPHLDELPPYGERQRVLSAPSLYALSPRILDHLSRVTPSPRGEREFPDALRLMIEEGGRVGGQVIEDRMTLTDPHDLLTINRHFLHSDPARAIIESDLPDSVRILPPVRIERGVRVAAGCQIGPEVYLEAGCSLGAGAVVHHAVILRSGRVSPGRVAAGTVVG